MTAFQIDEMINT